MKTLWFLSFPYLFAAKRPASNFGAGRLCFGGECAGPVSESADAEFLFPKNFLLSGRRGTASPGIGKTACFVAWFCTGRKRSPDRDMDYIGHCLRRGPRPSYCFLGKKGKNKLRNMKESMVLRQETATKEERVCDLPSVKNRSGFPFSASSGDHRQRYHVFGHSARHRRVKKD